MYYKAKNVDTNKALKAIAESIFECSNYEKDEVKADEQ